MATPARVERRTWVNVRDLSRRPLAIAAAILILIVAVVLVRGAKHGGKKSAILTAPVTPRNIALTIEATGTVEPIDLVEVKSKASGQIVRHRSVGLIGISLATAMTFFGVLIAILSVRRDTMAGMGEAGASVSGARRSSRLVRG